MAAVSPEFTHLHVHSEYSMLDGLSRVGELAKRAKELGMGAIALTDHGVLHGAIEFYEAAHQYGVKPIIGVEAYVAPRKLTNKEAPDRSAAHLILLAQNEVGYRNLLALTTIAHLDGFYYKPRIDHEVLAEHHEGLICLSACPSGEVAWALRHEDYAGARKAAAFYRDLFGRENFYLEMQNHGIDFQPTINRGVIQLAKELDLKLICTNDSHYTTRDDCDAQDLLLCIQTNAQVDDPKRMRAYTTEHYLKSPQEMFEVFGGELPEALRATMEVAEKCHLELTFGRLDFPHLPFVPEGESPMDYLARVCWENLPRRYEHVTPLIEERLRYELDVVRTTGFAAYILFVWDFVRFARSQNILCGPRGSAAGSIILYCLGITTIDPIAHDLTFERFLNPERIQMPDIDMDFADTRREEVIEYVANTYGRDHVAQIITFGRLLARGAVRDAGRALGYPLQEVDRVCKLVPTLPVGMTIDKALAASPELKQIYEGEPHIRRLVDAARQVEGVIRNSSTHAAGVVVSGEPLVHHVPLQKGARGEKVIMTQYEAHALETIGLLKMDFLGLTNLTLLENALKLIKETRGIELDLQHLPLDDAPTFAMLSNADTTGVFQLEGAGMRRTLREFRPSSVDHLAAIVALYRPGPMAHIPTYIAAKDGRREITYLHARLKPILESTYGIIVYQDQVLQIVRAIAGYSLGQADILRRAMGKKIKEEMAREKDNFLKGARKNGVEAGVAAKIWEYIEPFAGYAFNRAHAYCYAYIAYQTAYLKCNYPHEYMAAMLSTQGDDTDKVIAAAGECRRLGIELLPPSVNQSGVGFSVAGSPAPTGVRFGLGAIKNVGGAAAELIVAEREAHGPYRSLDDLCERLDLRSVNKRVLEALTKAGALDEFGPRERVIAALDRAMAAGQQIQRAAGIGQQSLFGEDDAAAPTALPAVPPITEQQRLAWEKESLGFFLSNHPFQAAARQFAGRLTATTSQITEELKGERVTLAGAIMSVRKIVTKRQETMAVARLEDLHGGIDVVAFPRTYAANPELWREDAIVLVSGKVDVRRLERNDPEGDEEARGVAELLVDHAEAWVPSAEPAAATTAPGPAPELPSAPTSGGDPWETPTCPEDDVRFDVVLEEPPSYLLAAAPEEAGATGAPEVRADAPADDRPPELPPLRRVIFIFRESADRALDYERLRQLYATLQRRAGTDPYAIRFFDAAGGRQLVGDALRVAYSAALEQEVEAILGAGAVLIER